MFFGKDQTIIIVALFGTKFVGPPAEKHYLPSDFYRLSSAVCVVRNLKDHIVCDIDIYQVDVVWKFITYRRICF